MNHLKITAGCSTRVVKHIKADQTIKNSKSNSLIVWRFKLKPGLEPRLATPRTFSWYLFLDMIIPQSSPTQFILRGLSINCQPWLNTSGLIIYNDRLIKD